jgi:hypothetical protein
MMKSRILPALFTCVLALSCCTPLLAQSGKTTIKEAVKVDEYGIALVRFIDMPGDKHRAVVDLSAPQDLQFTALSPADALAASDLKASNITIKFLPSGKIIPSTSINNMEDAKPTPDTTNVFGFGGTRLEIGIIDLPDTDPNQKDYMPNPGDDKVEITFGVMHFAAKVAGGATTALVRKNVVGTGKLYNKANINDRVEETRQALVDAVAHAKTDDEKDAFIAFSVVVPAGGNSQGSGDISFNRELYAASLAQSALFDHVKVGFHLNKASETASDPRHFDLGFTFRKTFLRADAGKLNNIKNAINNTKTEPDSKQIVQDINDLQQDFIRAYIFDNALRFEGDVSTRGIGNVSNLIWDAQLQVATVSRALAGQTGFWNFRWVPVGVEAGGNLTNNDNPTGVKGSLVRGKTGGEFNLIFKAGDPNEPVSRIQFTAKALERYLFMDENTLDPVTKLAVVADKGSKYWLQADVKIGTGVKVGAGRVGFRASFQRGYLPPVYNYVKTFNFGVVFETNDDDNSKNLKLK